MTLHNKNKLLKQRHLVSATATPLLAWLLLVTIFLHATRTPFFNVQGFIADSSSKQKHILSQPYNANIKSFNYNYVAKTPVNSIYNAGQIVLKNNNCRHVRRSRILTMAGTPMSIFGGNMQLSTYMMILHVVLGSIGTPFVAKAIPTWYPKIDKPRWTPPNRIFGPTWTLLYTLMGAAFGRILQQLTLESTLFGFWKHPLVLLWTLHMLLNITWAPIFFGMQKLRGGLFINYGLLATLCCMIIPWYMRIDQSAALMLIPYALWLIYATCLNRAICIRNPGQYNSARFYADLFKLQRNALMYANS